MTDEKPVIDPRAQSLASRAGGLGGNAQVSANPSAKTSFDPKPPLTEQEVEGADQANDPREDAPKPER